MTSAELFAATLHRRGIRWMATLCGHGLDPLYQALRNAGIRLVDTRNEQTASFIAEASGRLTRRPGVCATSSGVAFVNALSGLTNAFFDGAPMLLISGAGAHRTAGLGHFQDMDHVAVAAPLAKFARLIDRPERSAQILEQALDAASAWPPGPVHLTYPMDIQTAEVDPASAPRYVPAPALEPVGDVEQVAAALVRSERPLLVAGSGVFYAGEGEASCSGRPRCQAACLTRAAPVPAAPPGAGALCIWALPPELARPVGRNYGPEEKDERHTVP
jgi:acetolactate synthase-1/2/3 large subunit